MNSIFIELEYDEESFEKTFGFYEHDQFKVGGKVITNKDEIMLKSIKVVPKSFVDSITDGLTEFETYLKNDFGDDVTFDFLVYERTGLIY